MTTKLYALQRSRTHVSNYSQSKYSPHLINTSHFALLTIIEKFWISGWRGKLANNSGDDKSEWAAMTYFWIFNLDFYVKIYYYCGTWLQPSRLTCVDAALFLCFVLFWEFFLEINFALPVIIYKRWKWWLFGRQCWEHLMLLYAFVSSVTCQLTSLAKCVDSYPQTETSIFFSHWQFSSVFTFDVSVVSFFIASNLLWTWRCGYAMGLLIFYI